jgi:hypothetical protein
MSRYGNIILHTTGNKLFTQQISKGIFVNDTKTVIGGNANPLTPNNYASNVSCLGYNSQVTGNNQLQLGDSFTTTYAYGAIQNRSDQRDKTYVRDTILGLDFINKLRPVDFVWDFRENYVNNLHNILIDVSGNILQDITDASGNVLHGTGTVLLNPDASVFSDADGNAVVTFNDQTMYVNSNLIIIKDGSHKRSRYHHGLIAQELQSVLVSDSLDFGGLQHHSIAGGSDRFTIGYEELICPLIKSIQELKAQVQELTAQVEKLTKLLEEKDI